MNKLTYLFCFAGLLLFTNCTDEKGAIESEATLQKITQHWVLFEAERKGRKTETLTDAFLDLKAGGQATINIDGTVQDAVWNLEENVLKLSETQTSFLATDYQIQDLQDSLLVLKVELRSTPFLMKFNLKTEEE